jgi:hypothetical protein
LAIVGSANTCGLGGGLSVGATVDSRISVKGLKFSKDLERLSDVVLLSVLGGWAKMLTSWAPGGVSVLGLATSLVGFFAAGCLAANDLPYSRSHSSSKLHGDIQRAGFFAGTLESLREGFMSCSLIRCWHFSHVAPQARSGKNPERPDDTPRV